MDEKLKVEEPKTAHNMQQADHAISFLEWCHEDVFAKNDDQLEEQATLPNWFDTDLNLDPCHHEQETDCFMYAFVDNHECEFADQPAEEKVATSIFLFDDITYIFGKPRYDEYNDDYEVDSSEQAVALSKYENDCFQQSK